MAEPPHSETGSSSLSSPENRSTKRRRADDCESKSEEKRRKRESNPSSSSDSNNRKHPVYRGVKCGLGENGSPRFGSLERSPGFGWGRSRRQRWRRGHMTWRRSPSKGRPPPPFSTSRSYPTSSPAPSPPDHPAMSRKPPPKAAQMDHLAGDGVGAAADAAGGDCLSSSSSSLSLSSSSSSPDELSEILELPRLETSYDSFEITRNDFLFVHDYSWDYGSLYSLDDSRGFFFHENIDMINPNSDGLFSKHH